ncbi:MAG: methyltransferase domain-containing protein [Symploca sp. SIO3C6]|uniref:Methyltransferase domain-containing protein n=1 Tax=Symploca sp. SIO1C4 TaxID=2607765 RepID=A0A6B3NPF8_9CYAN|nr:methyltransferase domain-containing protein [Symploca sp. SIO3C6]NER32212.1 methyltransferase domain-containing protein [Symploca sp. SIO1C4]NET06259.1 methyltransferase domain-containing protein [Symploca sp. SIO2B6]
MTYKTNLSDYKQQVTAFFDGRTNYDNDFTYRRAIRLVELTPLTRRQQVLDVATGTGIVAIAAAEIVGSQGKVVGVDISPGMLKQAREKIEAAGIKNIKLIEADADSLNFSDESFDVILCSSSLVWLSNIPAALGNWYRWLKQGGLISFSCYSEKSFLTPILVKVCAQLYDISLPNWNEPLGTPQKCHQMLQEASFQEIEVKTEQLGKYLSLSDAKNWWQGDRVWINPRGNPLWQLSQEQLEYLKVAYDQEIESKQTAQGFWQEITTFFVTARK